MTSLYRHARAKALSALYIFPPTRTWASRRLPRHHSGYRAYWVDQGKNYRAATLTEDQSSHGMWDIPSPEELVRIVGAYAPESVLDVGCGYGRHLTQLAPYFNVEGCDVSEELLAQVPKDIHVFKADIVTDTLPKTWDVLYCWCVMMYFSDEEMRTVMQRLDAAANKKVIIWDWRHVCDRMREIYPSGKFEYHILPVSD